MKKERLLKVLKPWLTFHKSDLEALVKLILFLAFVTFFPLGIHFLLKGSDRPIDYADVISPKLASSPVSRTGVSKVLSRFDPNLADSAAWSVTGLDSWKVRMICHYVQKGGHFRTVGELKKIYSLNTADYEKIRPFLVIKSSEHSAQRFTHAGRFRSKSGFYRFVHAGNIQWQPGYPTVNSHHWQKIHLNSAGFAELKSLASLSYQDIKLILNYRKRNGDFTDIRELQYIGLLDAPTFKKIRPYISL